ncbi:MAG TPA: Hsp70 family protein [Thermoanaerobaculia bacterium]|jgi:molecular chaperone DnaK
MSAIAVAECRACHQWEPAPEDLYCSFCGELQLALELDKSAIVLISTLAAEKELRLRNDGPRAMRVEIRPRDGAPLPGIVFAPGPVVDIAAHSEVTVRFGVDAERLPAGFRRVAEYACIVDGDPRKQRRFELDVRSGPRPKVLQPSIDFADVQEGRAVERTIELSNQGSVALRIRDVRAEGSPHLTVDGEHADRVLKYGERLTIPVRWETPRGNASAASLAGAGVRIEFVNYPTPLFVPAAARLFRYRLEAQPASVRFPKALAKREHAMAIRLENGGTTDIEITAIESDQPWLHVSARATRFTLLCADSAAIPSPTTFPRSFEFRVVCRPQALAKGVHRGNVIVRPRGQEPLVVPVELTIVEPREYDDYIGIDFGTTNSVVAILSNRNESGIELVQDESSGKNLIPSVLVFDDPDTYKIGQAARNEADTAPDRTVRSIKRVMGYERDRAFFDRSYSAAELASLIIRKLVELAEKKIHLESTTGAHYNVRRAIITVPANFHDLQIRDVLEACHQAGLDTEEERARRVGEHQSKTVGASVNAGIILDEPSAAVLYYLDFLRRKRNSTDIMRAIAREQGLKMLVFDYGGGTLDVAVAAATQLPGGGIGLRIITSLGNNEIGGDTIDVLLMRELLARCRESLLPHFDFDTSLVSCTFREFERRGEVEDWPLDVRRQLLGVRAQWKDLAEEAKIQISSRGQIAVDVRPDLIVRVTRNVVETAPKMVRIPPLPAAAVQGLLQPVLTRCKDLITRLLGLANVKANEIDYILHTGRQSLMPQIRQCVRSLFPTLTDDRDLLEQEHLKVCVAKGAALYGSMRDRIADPSARVVLLSDGRRLPHSYGVETFRNPVEPELDDIIGRGEQYPVERTKTYPPAMIPPSGRLHLKFYQNAGTDHRIIGNRDVTLIGQIAIDTSNDGDGDGGCDVTFAVGANRTLSVAANGRPVTIEPARLFEEESWMG